MSRLPAARRDALAPAEQTIWDNIATHRPQMGGPYAMLMHVPALAARVAGVEDYLRDDSTISAADRELIILAVAREAGARYAWARHEARGLADGTRPEAIEAIRAHGALDALNPHERLLVDIVHALLRGRGLPADLYARAIGALGQQRLIETVALVGHYNLVGLMINSFEVPPPPDMATF